MGGGAFFLEIIKLVCKRPDPVKWWVMLNKENDKAGPCCPISVLVGKVAPNV